MNLHLRHLLLNFAAYEFGEKIQPGVDKGALFDALMLQSLCNKTKPTRIYSETMKVPSSTPLIGNTIFVAVDGDDNNAGTSPDKPKKTIMAGIIAR